MVEFSSTAKCPSLDLERPGESVDGAVQISDQLLTLGGLEIEVDLHLHDGREVGNGEENLPAIF